MDDMISRQAAIRAMADTECEYDISPYIKDERTEEQKRKDWFDMCKVLFRQIIEDLPSAQPEIIYCKDCVKHNKGHGYYLDGTVIGIKDCCPLVEIRGFAQGHEFDYQYCAYAERRQDGTRD